MRVFCSDPIRAVGGFRRWCLCRRSGRTGRIDGCRRALRVVKRFVSRLLRPNAGAGLFYADRGGKLVSGLGLFAAQTDFTMGFIAISSASLLLLTCHVSAYSLI